VPPNIPAPARLSANGRQAFTDFLKSVPHKAFGVSATGAYGWAAERRTTEIAKSLALGNRPTSGGKCRVVVIDDAELQ
jgi:hypothetical protein